MSGVRDRFAFRAALVVTLALSISGVAACTSDTSGDAVGAATLVLTASQQSYVASAALASKEVLALTGDHRIAAEHVTSSGATGYAQVYVRLLDGMTTLSGEWPHVVIDNPASCETCETDGPLRWHFESDTASYSVEAVLVNVEPNTGIVREVLPVPAPNAPAQVSTSAG